ncbi:MAG: hypothetical protein IIW17_04340 [Clostridia bacterium]|nr:hypothetical protein [Clostridia bacterium]
MGIETGQSKGAAFLAAYYLQNGKGTHAYRYFGVHRLLEGQGWSYVFRVAAPGADGVALVGEWNDWQPASMQRLAGSGVWEIVWQTDICPEGLRYKYRVQKGESVHDKADPYARMSESSGEGASVICTELHYAWQDDAYLELRAQKYADHVRYAYPMHVYEVDPVRWLGDERVLTGTVPSYRVIADLLAQYAADMRYTHLLLRFPGLQSGGREGLITRFAPDGMLGTPDDFAYLIDRMHKQGLGVILEMDCRCAGTHSAGVCNLDGCNLYAHAGHGAPQLDLTDPYATALLYSSALYWLRQYHVDGLYLNAEGMMPNRATGDFVHTLAAAVRAGVPDALLLLRASGYRGLSAGQALGGLGYDLVIDPATEAALLDCFSMSSALRVSREAWREIARGLYTEDAIIALSSAICTRQAGSVMGSLGGTHAEKFATMRLLYLFMICLPGKKLTFMGTELGQLTSACLSEGVEWFLRDVRSHAELLAFVKALHVYYLQTPPMWECDYSRDGLAGVECRDAPQGVLAFKRFDRAGREVCAVFNMSNQPAKGVRLVTGGRYPYYECAFSTFPDGSSERLQTDGQGCLQLDLEALSGTVLTPIIPTGGFWFRVPENE